MSAKEGIEITIHDVPDGMLTGELARAIEALRPSAVLVDTCGIGGSVLKMLRDYNITAAPLPKRTGTMTHGEQREFIRGYDEGFEQGLRQRPEPPPRRQVDEVVEGRVHRFIAPEGPDGERWEKSKWLGRHFVCGSGRDERWYEFIQAPNADDGARVFTWVRVANPNPPKVLDVYPDKIRSRADIEKFRGLRVDRIVIHPGFFPGSLLTYLWEMFDVLKVDGAQIVEADS